MRLISDRLGETLPAKGPCILMHMSAAEWSHVLGTVLPPPRFAVARTLGLYMQTTSAAIIAVQKDRSMVL